ncbi:DUF4132 domain-containing protein [Flammeovirga sp. EKP202]|uniref:DUF4132 domain-containing protein n=1 Tax=Flammeovirga sp. EKP202 TaxID=2770592 RepID=UPI00165F1B45|nr:DUF4132 domain-containing protein [Flammeovirga sp. EKP202]MBD0403917.1 DUF4132 domain-containing protein [Flammeovirga sp. EKP202]
MDNTTTLEKHFHLFTDQFITELKASNNHFKDDYEKHLEIKNIQICADHILKNKGLEEPFFSDLKLNPSYEVRRYVRNVISDSIQKHELNWVLQQYNFLSSIFNKKTVQLLVDEYHIRQYFQYITSSKNTDEALEAVNYMLSLGYSENEMFYTVFFKYGNCFFFEYTSMENEKIINDLIDDKIPLSNHGKLIMAYVKENPKTELIHNIINFILSQTYNSKLKVELTYFLSNYFPTLLKNSIEDISKKKESYYDQIIEFDVVSLCLKIDKDYYSNLFIELFLKDDSIHIAEKLSLVLLMNKHLMDYNNDHVIQQLGESYLTNQLTKYQGAEHRHHYASTTQPLLHTYFEYLIKLDEKAALKRISTFFKDSSFLPGHLFKFIQEQFGQESLPLLLEGLKKDKNTYKNERHYFVNFTKAISELQFDDVIDDLFLFAFSSTLKDATESICSLIGQSQKGVAMSIEFSKSKKAKERSVAVQVLSKVEGEDSFIALASIVDFEKNDDSRDSILEKIQDIRFNSPFTKLEVKKMIEAASNRKKLSKWSEKYLDEEKLPKLFYQDGGPLDNNAIRFLFYRVKRAKGMNSDIEAKQLIQILDKEKCGKFAKVLIQTFKETNADPKLKYYLTLAGLMGGDAVTSTLNTLFNQSLKERRVKMCEYILGALAMVSTNKALRIIDQVYRKMINKKPALSKVAQESLTVAANELNITLDELADRIIPNFDFEDNFKAFEVEGEEYRAFINSDFKLNFLNEDNKFRKSIPKATSPETKKELKEIEKGIREAVKGQTLRLERYLVEERRWKSENWLEYFLNNPILFVYANKLLWSVFDKNGAFVDSFYCDEDMCFYNAEGEEIELEEDHFISILHPIYLSDEQLSAWETLVYENDIKTVFPLLERKVFKPNTAELNGNVTSLFKDKKVPKGAPFVISRLEKKLWRKEASDGGAADFSKEHSTEDVVAHPNISGPAMFYTENDAFIGDIYFTRKGQYYYSTEHKNMLTLKDVPPVFFSEVMADMQELLDAK